VESLNIRLKNKIHNYYSSINYLLYNIMKFQVIYSLLITAVFLFPKTALALNTAIDLYFFDTHSGKYSDKLFFMGAGVVISIFIVIILLYRWNSSRKFKASGQELLKRQNVVQLQNKDLSPESIQVIQGLSKATQVKTETMLTFNRVFEECVLQMKRNSPNNPLLGRIQSLREELGFIFLNRGAEFVCSQMLLPGQKIRVAFDNKGKHLSFASTILHTTEDEFWIKPPKSKGKSVNLSSLNKMEFRVFRKDDSEYFFESALQSQVKKPTEAIIMSQTDQVQKWKFREDDRFDMKFERNFYISIKQPRADSATEKLSTLTLPGVVVDISIGGLRFAHKELPNPLVKGTFVMFKLPEANIKKNILTKIVRFSEEKKYKYIHLQFNELTELDRLNIQKFIENQKATKLEENY